MVDNLRLLPAARGCQLSPAILCIFWCFSCSVFSLFSPLSMGSSFLVRLAHQSSRAIASLQIDFPMSTFSRYNLISVHYTDITPLSTTPDYSTYGVLDSSYPTPFSRKYYTVILPDKIPMEVAILVHGFRLIVCYTIESHRSSPLFPFTTSALFHLTKRSKSPNC